MLWEESREDGKWRGYFGVWIQFNAASTWLERLLEGLPQTFETPMFWSEDEIKYLKGTAVHGMYDARRQK
jgi:hypothetical protein